MVPETEQESTKKELTTTDLVERFRRVRSATRELIEGLSAEDCQIQSMDDVSPTKWHLAHTTWFFETFLLANRGEPFHPEYRYLYNSYYNAVGEQFSRPHRGHLSRPSLDEVLQYREHVDARVQTISQLSERERTILEIGLHHEQQHQELMLMDIKHVFSVNPLKPSYRPARRERGVEVPPMKWHRYGRTLARIGHDGRGFAFDNEGPRHEFLVPAFELGSRLVTNREYLEFIEAGGYQTPELWLSDGWAKLQEAGWEAPLYWEQHDGRWFTMTLAGLEPLQECAPVCHVSHYEADAYASWKDARLPTEQEWELAAQQTGPDAADGNFVEDGALHPVPATDSGEDGPIQLLGDVWEWTRSPYTPYPGFRASRDALGEYNGKFMNNQMVLRGGCCATPRSHIRTTYRNFFPSHSRWMFSGIRLARDVD